MNLPVGMIYEKFMNTNVWKTASTGTLREKTYSFLHGDDKTAINKDCEWLITQG